MRARAIVYTRHERNYDLPPPPYPYLPARVCVCACMYISIYVIIRVYVYTRIIREKKVAAVRMIPPSRIYTRIIAPWLYNNRHTTQPTRVCCIYVYNVISMQILQVRETDRERERRRRGSSFHLWLRKHEVWRPFVARGTLCASHHAQRERERLALYYIPGDGPGAE